MKKYIYYSVAALALASCANDEFMGDNSQPINKGNQPINLNSGFNAITRTDTEGAAAATLLNNEFVVFGNKTNATSDPSVTQTVFDNYVAKFVDGSATSTTSNSAGWEYVGYDSKATTPVTQSIKYWDFSANTTYGFFAYSLGAGVTSGDPATTTYATASIMASASSAKNAGTYTLEGTAQELAACYISDKLFVTPAVDATEVNLRFKSMAAKVRLGIYETIPGYSVKNVKFYDADDNSQVAAVLFDAGLTPSLPAGGTYTITFDTDGTALVAFSNDGSYTNAANLQLGNLNNYAAKEYKEADGNYLGRLSSEATFAGAAAPYYTNVLPNAAGTELTLKVDYTLVSRDGNGETIEIKGATAIVPKEYAMWKPNYAYTYIFKISDNTNGQTGSVTGLYPITLDAIVVSDEVGNQETITTVADPSITTYQKGATGLDEYQAGDIYVVVEDGAALTSSNAKLYTATIEAGAAQGITEASVANALENGTESPTGTWTVTDAAGKNLVITSSNKLTTDLTTLPAAAAVDGIDHTINCAKIDASASTIYVFEYNDGAKKHYKVIKVGA